MTSKMRQNHVHTHTRARIYGNCYKILLNIVNIVKYRIIIIIGVVSYPTKMSNRVTFIQTISVNTHTTELCKNYGPVFFVLCGLKFNVVRLQFKCGLYGLVILMVYIIYIVW